MEKYKKEFWVGIRTYSRSILLLYAAMSLVTNDVSMKERGIGTNCIWSIDSILHPVRFMIYFLI